MYENKEKIERAVLAGVHTGAQDILADTNDETIQELELLAKTAGAQVCAVMVQNRPRPDAGTYFGEGKLEELKNACVAENATLIIVDDELSGSQLRNIENATDVRVIDRSALILDIFAQRALSREGKLQVELAQLRYRLPRLSGSGTALSRLGGGIGTRGPGETKLESDRRHIHRRIGALEAELRDVERHRALLRERRKKSNTTVAALVGYTNAGKSTLMNALTNAGVYVENKLFATLDTTSRSLRLPSGKNIMLIDTVGFIRKLPHHLIKAFKSTLEEAVNADILLHVIDSSSDTAAEQIAVTDALLEELGCSSKPTIAVFNKCDKVGDVPRAPGNYGSFVSVSAKNKFNIDTLLSAIEECL
ncbi:MAG: GTPase HflX [Clostridia bacterium]|nr:GTPase HflX [Clostridia bacterium]